MARRLLAGGAYTAIATHDDTLVASALTAASELGLARDRYEFQVLYGMRRDLQESLVARGNRMRVYMPFGTHWYGYLTRRLAERPANLWFFLRNAARR
jgi:proline dehydrogenase